MKLVDANVLITAVNDDDARHDEARSWLDAALSDNETVGLPWIVLVAFIRLTTHHNVFAHPLTPSDACAQVQRWLDSPATVVVAAGSRHLAILRDLLDDADAAGNLTTDAHLAAIAIEHNADVVSYGRDFRRFPGVTHLIPGQ